MIPMKPTTTPTGEPLADIKSPPETLENFDAPYEPEPEPPHVDTAEATQSVI